MSQWRVLGADVCSKGYVGVAVGPHVTAAYFGPTIRDLLAAAEADGDIDVVALHIPIGLADTGHRLSDEHARKAAGPPRWQSAFVTPVRQAMLAGDHASAVLVNQQLAGQGSLRSGLWAANQDLGG